MASSTVDGGEPEQEIRLVDSGEWWVATDVETGIASQGKTREAALAHLDEALALHRDESEESVDTTLEREVFRELGIDPAEVEAAREERDSLPEFMQ